MVGMRVRREDRVESSMLVGVKLGIGRVWRILSSVKEEREREICLF